MADFIYRTDCDWKPNSQPAFYISVSILEPFFWALYRRQLDEFQVLKMTMTWSTYVDNIHHCYVIICAYTNNLHRACPHYRLKHTAAVLMNYMAPPPVIWTQLEKYCRAWAGQDRHQVKVRPILPRFYTRFGSDINRVRLYEETETESHQLS